MKMSDILEEENLIPDLKAKDKKKAIEELANAVVKTNPGDGVAIPHGKFPGIIAPIISFGRSRKGLDFESMDGQPVFLFFLLVAPEDSASVHLKALARIAKMLKDSNFRKLLIEAPNRKELYKIIIQNDEEF